jgi:hypothetical protein
MRLLRDLAAALQNLHPRFKSGRRLQLFLNDFANTDCHITWETGKGSGFARQPPF